VGVTDNNLLLGTAEADATDRINVDKHPEFNCYQRAHQNKKILRKFRMFANFDD